MMNRVEKKKMIFGFMMQNMRLLQKIVTLGNPSDDVELEEEIHYALDEYLGMQDDILVGAEAEMAVFVEQESKRLKEEEDSRRLRHFDTDPPSTPTQVGFPAPQANTPKDGIITAAETPDAKKRDSDTLVFDRKGKL